MTDQAEENVYLCADRPERHYGRLPTLLLIKRGETRDRQGENERMADIIHLLPDSEANKIAAGEVVQRPASVVKELIENALDAEATEINIFLQEAGKESIIVSDNGKGMSETDARMAFERHATSKISSIDDLKRLSTMGFRGEALPSIASVAQVELKTRREKDEIGVDLLISGSRVERQEPIACGAGATFIVNDLFFNVPVRRKFLKSTQTELNCILSEFERFALINHQLRISISHNKTLLYSLYPESRLQRIVSLFGKKMEKQLLPLHVETDIVKISGFIGMPESGRQRGAQQFFFVNGRFTRHPFFHRAIVKHFAPLLKPGEQVPYFIHFEVDPAHIDVNSHPTKTEVRFDDDLSIVRILTTAISATLAKHNALPTIDFDLEGKPDIPSLTTDGASLSSFPMPKAGDYNPFATNGGGGIVHTWQPEVRHATRRDPSFWIDLSCTPSHEDRKLYQDAPPSEQSGWEENTSLHYLHKGRYILTSLRSGLLVVDIQRAQERILYERYREQLKNHPETVSQTLMYPEEWTLSQRERMKFASVSDALREIGFVFQSQSNGNVTLTAVPAGLEEENLHNFLLEILEEECPEKEEIRGHIHAILAKNRAKREATKVPPTLSNKQMADMMADLYALQEKSQYTEEGLHISAMISNDDIEKMFS